MKTLEQITKMAQADANRDNKPVAILNLNLNQFSPLYVVRNWDDRFVGSRELVKRIDPQ